MKKQLSVLLTVALLIGMFSVAGFTFATAAYTLGDLNGDGAVTTYDARLLLSYLVADISMTPSQKTAADVNKDAAVNTSDIKAILNIVMTTDFGVLQQADLLAPSQDDWNNPIQTASGYHCTVKQAESAAGGYTFVNVTETDERPGYQTGINPHTWPYTAYAYENKLLLPPSATIEYDLTVVSVAASIRLYLGGDRPPFDENSYPAYVVLNSYISSNLDYGSGDLKSGTYKGTISVESLINSGNIAADCLVDGNLWVSGIMLYVVGHNGEEVTVRSLSVDKAYVSGADIAVSSDPLESIRTGLVSASETADLPTLTGLELYQNGQRTAASSMTGSADNKKIYHTENFNRVMNYADGYKIDIPHDWVPDYSLSALRSRYSSDTCVLTVSKEEENPYSNWDTYMNEWLIPYISNESFLSENYMRYLREPIYSEYILSGYTVMTYDIAIDWQGQIEMPYYSIAIIRKFYTYDTFYLMVLKSAVPTDGMIDRLIRSFEEITVKGTAVNSQGQYEKTIPHYWSEETKAYYNKLCTQDSTDWGFFSYSMVANNDSLYGSQYDKIVSEQNRIEAAIGQSYDILPTYTHLAYGNYLNKFPLDMAEELAGGNGFNGKPVLQYTYQYTMTNNTNLSGPTPIFNVLRGDYDAHFREMAQDIKTYGKPVLFRLNNEMNTDWTSYCGLVSLLDPDIFIMGWQHLYDIFVEEGVDNCIWIFNPFTPTTPYSSWGETLCYMPGSDYVQILGLTNYEMGNETPMASFKEEYTEVYTKSKDYFIHYPWVISEFACGAGGEKYFNWTYETWQNSTLGRYRQYQANYINGMFNCLNNRHLSSNAFCKNIKAAVWFNCNDVQVIGGAECIVNYLELDESSTVSLNAFKNGLAAGS